jgi:pimeloyl-ACP methyl ester carboxylesterase
MQIEVNGTRLWFDVVGPSLVADGPRSRARPTLLALHGGPAGYDHSYLRPHLDRLAALTQVVYIDLPGHGRSDHGDVASWSLERCADDLRAFCERLGIVQPLLFGHSMGGFVALLLVLRHPGYAGGLLLQATAARHDVSRIVREFRTRFGDELARIAANVFGGGTASFVENRRTLEAFGPHRPDGDTYGRIIPNPGLKAATSQVARFDVAAELHRIDVPTLVTVGTLDPVTPVAAAHEIVDGLTTAPCHLEVLEDAGHFPWLDDPDRYWPHIERFVRTCSGQHRSTRPTDRPATWAASDASATGGVTPA